jgi:AraC-like DNA-binding protein/quercetin dioxygenase-like cupin family protein
MQKRKKSERKTKKTIRNFEFEDPLSLDSHLSVYTNSISRGDQQNGLFHFHNSLELGLCLKGSGTFTIEDRSIRYARDDIFVIGPGLIHSAVSDPEDDSRWIWIFADIMSILAPYVHDTDILDCSPYSVTSCPVMHMRKAEHPHFHMLLAELAREYEEKGPHDAMRALLVLIMTYLRRQIGQQGTAGPSAAISLSGIGRIIPALKLINARFGDKLTIAEMASACFMGDRSFGGAFEQAMRETPHAYLTRFRIAQACGALAASQESINRIASQCGFESMSSFNRSFKAVAGTTPIEYRKSKSANRDR